MNNWSCFAGNIPRRPVEPRKPPTYTDEPPPYSSEMPESHFRPITVTGHFIPYNQRYRTPVMQHSGQQNNTSTINYQNQSVHSTQIYNSQNRNDIADGVRRARVGIMPEESSQEITTQLPGVPTNQQSPTYSENPNAQILAQRRRRFIQSPPNLNDNYNEQTLASEGSEIALSRTATNKMEASDSVISTAAQTGSRQVEMVPNRQTQHISNTSALAVAYTRPQSVFNSTYTQGQNMQQPIAESIIRQQAGHLMITEQGGNSRMEPAISRARSRQIVTSDTLQRNQIISRRQTSTQRQTAGPQGSEIEELACL